MVFSENAPSILFFVLCERLRVNVISEKALIIQSMEQRRAHNARADAHASRQFCNSQSGEMMNWEQVESRWKALTKSAKENWSKLTDGDLDEISGRREQLISKVETVYGISRR